MRSLILLTAAAAISAAAFAPDSPAGPGSEFPWPEPVLRAAALGRRSAAADMAWIRTVQTIGSSSAQARGYPHLEGWIDLTTSLDSRFDLPYYLGAILIATDDARASTVDALLARGEQALPDQFELTMYRGFVAHFGQVDPLRAAPFYRAAARKPRAPPFLNQLADRLEREDGSCERVLGELRQVSSAMQGAQGQAMDSTKARVFWNCTKLQIERRAAAWRVKNDGKAPTVDDLVKAGLFDEAPASPSGQCWSLDGLQHANLGPCSPEKQQ